jgi:hypothetical protein
MIERTQEDIERFSKNMKDIHAARNAKVLEALKNALEFVIQAHGGENYGDIQQDLRAAIKEMSK